MKKFIIGAHYGMRDWIFQRISAAFMIVYTFIFIAAACYFGIGSFEAWHGLFAMGPMKFLTFIFLVCVMYHAWVGMRDIFIDYVQPMWIKLPLLSVTVLVLVGYMGWAAEILWRL